MLTSLPPPHFPSLFLAHRLEQPGPKVGVDEPTLQHVLKRWGDLGGSLVDPSDDNELVTSVMLARSCWEPPPVSTLPWPAPPAADDDADAVSFLMSGGAGASMGAKLNAAGSDGAAAKATPPAPPAPAAPPAPPSAAPLAATPPAPLAAPPAAAAPAATPPLAGAAGAPAAGGASPFPGFSASDVADAAALAGGRAKRPGAKLEAEKDKQVRRMDGSPVSADERNNDAAAAAAAVAAAAVAVAAAASAAPPAAPTATPAAPAATPAAPIAAPSTTDGSAAPAPAAPAAPAAPTAAAPAPPAVPAAPGAPAAPAPGSVPI